MKYHKAVSKHQTETAFIILSKKRILLLCKQREKKFTFSKTVN